jgi:hypothetical protein
MKTAIVLISLIGLCGCERNQQGPTSASGAGIVTGKHRDPTQAISVIAENRDLATGAVSEAKSKWKSDSSEYTNARRLYNAAKAKNSGWLEAVTYALREGNPLDTADFKQKAQEAEGARKAFVEYVNSPPGVKATPVPKEAATGALVVVGALVDAGWKIYDAYKTRAKAERVERATYVKTTLAWPSWDDTK